MCQGQVKELLFTSSRKLIARIIKCFVGFASFMALTIGWFFDEQLVGVKQLLRSLDDSWVTGVLAKGNNTNRPKG